MAHFFSSPTAAFLGNFYCTFILPKTIDAISDFLFTTDSEFQVYVCILDRRSFEVSKELALNAYLQEGSRRFIYEEHTLKMCSSPEPLEEVCYESAPDPELSVPVVPELSAPFVAGVIPPVEKKQAPVDLAKWIEKQDAWCLRLFVSMVGTFLANPLSV